jgi:hypothetical protein
MHDFLTHAVAAFRNIRRIVSPPILPPDFTHDMHTRSRQAAALASIALFAPATLHAQARPTPQAIVDVAMDRMGGRATLARVERARFENITQWLHTTFDREPGADAPTYELHTDTRDYTIGGWRNVRRFPTPGGGPWREMTDVVRDSVAIRRLGGIETRWQPLNVAYVDERNEIFTLAPERLLPAARDARDLRARGDTLLNGVRYHAVSATIDGLPLRLLFNASTGYLSAALFTAAQPNDFGLAPWGAMPVELWYARWQRMRGGIAYPTQLDVMRAGRPYKRVSVVSAAFDVAATPDSFAVSDSLRTGFVATQRHAMHDTPLDSARVVEGAFATFGTFGPPAGAIKVGGEWVMLEAGQAGLNAERSAAWLRQADGSGGRLAVALITVPYAGNGGVTWLARHGTPLIVAPGARPFVDAMLKYDGSSARPAALTTVTTGRWLKVGTDSLRLEPIDLPSGRGALLVYVPSLKWAYAGLLATPLDMEAIMARASVRGWTVERVGSRRGIATPVPAPAAAATR